MFREVLYLAKHGVPWTVIMSWSRRRRIAACVTIAEQDGFVFDWDACCYREM